MMTAVDALEELPEKLRSTHRLCVQLYATVCVLLGQVHGGGPVL